MRICHVSPHVPPDQAANALLPAQLGQWMCGRGDEVAYVAHMAGQGTPEAADHGSRSAGRGSDLAGAVRWIPRRSRSRTVRASRLDAWRIARQIDAALTEVAGNADLLHLHSNGLIVEVAAAWARRRRLPYVLTLYGTEIWHYRKRWPLDLFTQAYRSAAHVTFYSAGLLGHAKTLGLDRPGISVIYPPVSEAFKPRDAATRQAWRTSLGIRERALVLNVKRLHELAGQRFLIDAFADVARAHQDVRLVIGGTGPLRGSLEAQARRLGVADRVTFPGLLPNETVARYMAAADVFVLPSLLEALPTVAIEALASGTPVLSADHPGGVELRDIFGDDVQVVPRETVQPLAEAVRDILEHPRRTRPETAGRLEERFRPAAALAAFDAVYRKAVTA